MFNTRLPARPPYRANHEWLRKAAKIISENEGSNMPLKETIICEIRQVAEKIG